VNTYRMKHRISMRITAVAVVCLFLLNNLAISQEILVTRPLQNSKLSPQLFFSDDRAQARFQVQLLCKKIEEDARRYADSGALLSLGDIRKWKNSPLAKKEAKKIQFLDYEDDIFILAGGKFLIRYYDPETSSLEHFFKGEIKNAVTGELSIGGTSLKKQIYRTDLPIAQEHSWLDVFQHIQQKGRLTRFTDINRGYFEYDPKREYAICEMNPETGEVKVHEEFIADYEDIKDTAIGLPYMFRDEELDQREVRWVDLADSIAYRAAMHEFNLEGRKGLAHAYLADHTDEFRIHDNEEAANWVGRNYSVIDDAIWLWYLHSYKMNGRLRYDNDKFAERIDWIFAEESEKAKRACGQFSRLKEPKLKESYEEKCARLALQEKVRHLALLINEKFFIERKKEGNTPTPAYEKEGFKPGNFEATEVLERIDTYEKLKKAFSDGTLLSLGLDIFKEKLPKSGIELPSDVSRVNSRVTNFDICMLPFLEEVPHMLLGEQDFGIRGIILKETDGKKVCGIEYMVENKGKFTRLFVPFNETGQKIFALELEVKEKEYFDRGVSDFAKAIMLSPFSDDFDKRAQEIFNRGLYMARNTFGGDTESIDIFRTQEDKEGMSQDPPRMAYTFISTLVLTGLLREIPGILRQEVKLRREEWSWIPRDHGVEIINKNTGDSEFVEYDTSSSVAGLPGADRVKEILESLRMLSSNQIINELDRVVIESKRPLLTEYDRLRVSIERVIKNTILLAYDDYGLYQGAAAERVPESDIASYRFTPEELRLLWRAIASLPEDLQKINDSYSTYRPNHLKNFCKFGQNEHSYLVFAPKSMRRAAWLHRLIKSDEIANKLSDLENEEVVDLSYVRICLHEKAHRIYMRHLTEEARKEYSSISWDVGGDSWQKHFQRTIKRKDGDEKEHFLIAYVFPEDNSSEEDFADQLTAYVLFGPGFRAEAEKYAPIKAKYEFFKKHVFGGKEYGLGVRAGGRNPNEGITGFYEKPLRELDQKIADIYAMLGTRKDLLLIMLDVDDINLKYQRADTKEKREILNSRVEKLCQKLVSIQRSIPLSFDASYKFDETLDYEDYQAAIELCRMEREKIYKEIKTVNSAKDKTLNKKEEELEELNKRAVGINEQILKLQLHRVKMMLEGDSLHTRTEQAMRSDASMRAAWTMARESARKALDSALSTVEALKREYVCQAERLEVRAKKAERMTVDETGTVTTVMGPEYHDMTVGEKAYLVRETRWIRPHAQLIKIRQAINPKKGGMRIGEAKMRLSDLRKLYSGKARNQEVLSKLNSLLAIIETKNLENDGVILGETRRIINDLIDELVLQVKSTERYKVPKDVSYRGTERAYKGKKHTVHRYEEEDSVVVSSARRNIKFYVGLLEEAIVRGKDLSKKNQAIILDGLMYIQGWCNIGMVFPKAFAEEHIPRVSALIDKNPAEITTRELETAAKYLRDTAGELAKRLDEIEGIIPHIEDKGTTIFVELRDKDCKLAADALKDHLEKIKDVDTAEGEQHIDEAIKLIDKLKETYFKAEHVEPGYKRAELILNRLPGTLRWLKRNIRQINRPKSAYQTTLEKTISDIDQFKNDIVHKASYKIIVILPDGKERIGYRRPGITVGGLLGSLGRNPSSYALIDVINKWISVQQGKRHEILSRKLKDSTKIQVPKTVKAGDGDDSRDAGPGSQDDSEEPDLRVFWGDNALSYDITFSENAMRYQETNVAKRDSYTAPFITLYTSISDEAFQEMKDQGFEGEEEIQIYERIRQLGLEGAHFDAVFSRVPPLYDGKVSTSGNFIDSHMQSPLRENGTMLNLKLPADLLLEEDVLILDYDVRVGLDEIRQDLSDRSYEEKLKEISNRNKDELRRLISASPDSLQDFINRKGEIIVPRTLLNLFLDKCGELPVHKDRDYFRIEAAKRISPVYIPYLWTNLEHEFAGLIGSIEPGGQRLRWSNGRFEIWGAKGEVGDDWLEIMVADNSIDSTKNDIFHFYRRSPQLLQSMGIISEILLRWNRYPTEEAFAQAMRDFAGIDSNPLKNEMKIIMELIEAHINGLAGQKQSPEDGNITYGDICLLEEHSQEFTSLDEIIEDAFDDMRDEIGSRKDFLSEEEADKALEKTEPVTAEEISEFRGKLQKFLKETISPDKPYKMPKIYFIPSDDKQHLWEVNNKYAAAHYSERTRSIYLNLSFLMYLGEHLREEDYMQAVYALALHEALHIDGVSHERALAMSSMASSHLERLFSSAKFHQAVDKMFLGQAQSGTPLRTWTKAEINKIPDAVKALDEEGIKTSPIAIQYNTMDQTTRIISKVLKRENTTGSQLFSKVSSSLRDHGITWRMVRKAAGVEEEQDFLREEIRKNKKTLGEMLAKKEGYKWTRKELNQLKSLDLGETISGGLISFWIKPGFYYILSLDPEIQSSGCRVMISSVHLKDNIPVITFDIIKKDAFTPITKKVEIVHKQFSIGPQRKRVKGISATRSEKWMEVFMLQDIAHPGRYKSDENERWRLADLLRKEEGFDWNTLDLSLYENLPLGKTNVAGQMTLSLEENFSDTVTIPDCGVGKWDITLKSINIENGFPLVTLELAKEGASPIIRKFKIGPGRKKLRGFRDRSKEIEIFGLLPIGMARLREAYLEVAKDPKKEIRITQGIDFLVIRPNGLLKRTVPAPDGGVVGKPVNVPGTIRFFKALTVRMNEHNEVELLLEYTDKTGTERETLLRWTGDEFLQAEEMSGVNIEAAELGNADYRSSGPGTPGYSEGGVLRAKMIEYLDANKKHLTEMLEEEKEPILLEVPVEVLEAIGEENARFLVDALQGTTLGKKTNVAVKPILGSRKTVIHYDPYKKFGIEKKEFPEEKKDRLHRITLFLPDQWGGVDDMVLYDTVDLDRNEIPIKGTIWMPVGLYNAGEDTSGLLRSAVLGMRLIKITRSADKGEDHEIFAYETARQFIRLCQNASEIDENGVLFDLLNIALSTDVNGIIRSLRRIVALLPITPINIEERRKMYEYAREVILAA